MNEVTLKPGECSLVVKNIGEKNIDQIMEAIREYLKGSILRLDQLEIYANLDFIEGKSPKDFKTSTHPLDSNVFTEDGSGLGNFVMFPRMVVIKQKYVEKEV